MVVAVVPGRCCTVSGLEWGGHVDAVCLLPMVVAVVPGRCCTVASNGVAMWMLCVYCGMACGLPVSSRYHGIFSK